MRDWFLKFADHPTSVETKSLETSRRSSFDGDYDADYCNGNGRPCGGEVNFWHTAMSHCILRRLSSQDPSGILDISALVAEDIEAIKPNKKSDDPFVCGICHGHLIRYLQEFREETWRKLADFFSEELHDAGN
ncbi:hypothetical protein FRC03_000862 [Tulasnella sp. 419]|nr:hypothetical protein FRC03_000862 [Tulasnella sp. 419]